MDAVVDAPPNLDLFPADNMLLDDVEFAKAYLKVKPKVAVAGGISPLIANRAQQYIAANWHRRLLILKARQLGCSTWIQARFFRKTITNFGVNTAIISHKPDTTGALMEISKMFYECLPDAIKPALKYDSFRRMTFRSLRSSLFCGSADKGGYGHGLTLHNLHASELAWWKYPEQLNGMLQAVPIHGNSDVVIESTPNGAFGLFYEMCMKALQGVGGWRLLFLPWWMDDEYALPLEPLESLEHYEDDELNLILKEGLTPAQIKWRRYMLAQFDSAGSRDEFFQEYPEDPIRCFLSGGSCFFSIVAISRLLSRCPPKPLFVNDAGWHVYSEPVPGERYVMGVDTAGGEEGGDFSAGVIRAFSTNERVAVLNEKITPFQLARASASAGEYFNWALIGAERNGMGMSTIEKLVVDLEYENMFYASDGRPGWNTTSTTRPVMLSDLRQEVSDEDAQFNDERLLHQFLRFMKGKSIGGKPAAASGEHDDLVIADAIAGQMRKMDEGGAAML